MINRNMINSKQGALAFLVLSLFFVTSSIQAANVTVNVVDGAGNPVPGFKWLLQNDLTYQVDPANDPQNHPDDLLSLGFHTSHHTVAQKDGGADSGSGQSGSEDTDSATITDVAAGNYYVSVLAYEGHSISGTPVQVADSNVDETVTVVLQAHPIPTTQIAIYLFHDNNTINGAPDLPVELNPAPGEAGHVDWTQFSIILEEPAGRYGIAGGQVIQDAFGNPLGTTYDANGDVVSMGDGTLQPEADGTLLVKNLAPGKYGVVAIPPTKGINEENGWQQTSTIEGSKVIDAWVKANEPPFFVEFGLPGPHVFIGFVKSTTDGGFQPLQPPLAGEQVADISGTITDMHMSRAPSTQFFSGRTFPGCWVGLNDGPLGLGRGLWAEPCDGDSNFIIPDVPPGNYQLAIWDANLDVVIAAQPFSVDPTGGTCNGGLSCDFGEVAVFNWFTRLNAGVFNDDNENGFWDANEAGIGPESQEVVLRWRDGSVYQAFPTDNDGLAPFDEIFPFFHWLVAEVSFANKKATGATFVVDNGGFVDTTTDAFPGFGELAPQPQANGDLWRTETGEVLTQAFQGFLGQTSVMHFGKKDYVTFSPPQFGPPFVPPQYVGENGGISGIVFYATTRAEDEPQFAAAEEWEPGIPRVQVALYADGDILGFGNSAANFPNGVGDVDWNGNGIIDPDDGIIDDVNQNDVVDLADVDNHPLGNFPGPEDIDRDGDNTFDFGDALQVTHTDSWDDDLPTGCGGANNVDAAGIGLIAPVEDDRCFDGLRNFNQVRPGVFDGGYAFGGYELDSLVNPELPQSTRDSINAFYNQAGVQAVGFEGILPADYIVEAAAPPGYETLREEHKNVDFGDEYQAAVQALPVACVGDDHIIPRYLQMQTVADAAEIDGRRPVVPAADLIDAPFAGDTRPLCDRKQVPLSAGQNAAADFFLMTDVPPVANVSGMMLNDVANEFNPNSPAFGEKFAPPNLPVAFYDWNGVEVYRTYGDKFGRFNAVLPSTSTANLGIPSGMSPNMLISCMNDAGPIPNPEFDPTAPPDSDAANAPEFIVDPFFNPQYSQFCYTFQYMPGVITYLDTPVVSVAAHANDGSFPVDCQADTQTPMVASVTRRPGGWGPFGLVGDSVRIRSMGRVDVPNPDWDGQDLTQRTIQRDYRFVNDQNVVYLEDADGVRTLMPITSDNNNRIDVTVPNVAAGDYQIVVMSDYGSGMVESPIGVTFTVGVQSAACPTGTGYPGNVCGERPNGGLYAVHKVGGNGFTTIQEAIDFAASGDLITVRNGVYDELVIMWKPVKLQGWGAGGVTLNARQVPTEKIQAWREKAQGLVAFGLIDRLPGQNLGVPTFPALAEIIFPTEEGAGIFVAGKATGPDRFGRLANRGARIDGLTILGASTGGGIVANGYNQFLNISNNRLTANAGFYGGGIRVGHPLLTSVTPDGDPIHDDAVNDNVRIHHNQIIQNGAINNLGAGGGISLHTGADGYRVTDNWICGNFSQGDGAGIGHLGLSRGGLIEDNHIVFNENFSQTPGSAPSGGGIFIGGKPGLAPDEETGLLLSTGAGNVTIDANIIRGNLAGAGDGGGIRISQLNGVDVALNDNRGQWYRVNVFNNMITNNVAGVAGGGISLGDSLRVNIRNNTIANNDSTSTGSQAFPPGPTNNLSVPLPAGIVSRVHTQVMADLVSLPDVAQNLPAGRSAQWQTFSDAFIRNDIVHSNRSFFWSNFDDPSTPVIESGLLPLGCTDVTGGDASCVVQNPPAPASILDLGVLDGITITGDSLNVTFSLLTDDAGTAASNITGDPAFVSGYWNTARGAINIPEFKTLQTAGAFDEGGNFLQVQFGPLSLIGFDYHLTGGSDAINQGHPAAPGRLASDIDNEPRPAGTTGVDIGADELQ